MDQRRATITVVNRMLNLNKPACLQTHFHTNYKSLPFDLFFFAVAKTNGKHTKHCEKSDLILEEKPLSPHQNLVGSGG